MEQKQENSGREMYLENQNQFQLLPEFPLKTLSDFWALEDLLLTNPDACKQLVSNPFPHLYINRILIQHKTFFFRQ